MTMPPTAPPPTLRLVVGVARVDADALTEREQRRLARERHMANHPAGRRRHLTTTAAVPAAPRLHLVPDASEDAGR